MILQKILLFISPIYRIRIKGDSMFPTFKDGEVVVMNRLSYFISKPKVNDMVVVRSPEGRIIVKRIIKIQKDSVFIEGDNMMASRDSKVFGWIKNKNILGKII